jgi:hypothetical protein
VQRLTAAPRADLSEDAVADLLNADALTVSAGLELLDLNDRVVEDLSNVLVDGTVKRENAGTVHGSCSLTIERELAWGRDRVRPFLTLSDGERSARFNLGVYVLTTPEQKLDPLATWAVDGFDKMNLLQGAVGDTYTVAAGANVLGAVRAAIAAAGAGANVLLDPAAAAKTLASAMVWPLVETNAATWLGIVNDLLAAVGYRGLWVDENGTYRSEPYVEPSARPIEWRFNVDDPRTTLVAEDRSVAQDVWNVPNVWRFVRRGLDVAPVEGAGFYTVRNNSDGLSSIASVGREVWSVVWLDAVDQAALVTQGVSQVNTDKAVTAVVTMKTAPLPIAGHYDVATLADAKLAPAPVKLQARSWELPLSGADMSWSWEVV